MNVVTPTGQLARRTVTFTREFNASQADVWAAITDPERMQRWLGSTLGDPTSGAVKFRMIVDGEDAPWEPVTVVECHPTERLHVHWLVDGETWDVLVELSERSGVTSLQLHQTFHKGKTVEMVGPGWEHCLDRMVAHMAGNNVDDVAWSDYYPAMTAYYEKIAQAIDTAPH